MQESDSKVMAMEESSGVDDEQEELVGLDATEQSEPYDENEESVVEQSEDAEAEDEMPSSDASHAAGSSTSQKREWAHCRPLPNLLNRACAEMLTCNGGKTHRSIQRV